MAIPSRAAHSAAELACINRPAPAILGQNWLRSATGRWARDASAATNLTLSSTNYSDSVYPISNLSDGSLAVPSRPLTTTGIRQYSLIFDLGAAREIDTIMLKPLDGSLAGLDVDVFLSTSSAFGGSDTVDVNESNWHGLANSRKRLQAMNIGNASDGRGVWTAQYVKFRFTDTVDIVSTISISEILIGRRRQFTFGSSLPFDPRQVDSSWDDFEARGGHRARRVHYRGRAIRSCNFELADFTAAGGLDDREQSRLLWSDCDYGTRPVWYIEAPFDAASDAVRANSCFGFFEDGSFERSFQGPVDQSWSFEIRELPEYVSQEA